MAKKVAKLEKAQTSGKQKAKAKTTKKAPAKEPTARTANDQVVNIIRRSKKGADGPTLIKKTGFENKKIGIWSSGRPSRGKSSELAGGFIYGRNLSPSHNICDTHIFGSLLPPRPELSLGCGLPKKCHSKALIGTNSDDFCLKSAAWSDTHKEVQNLTIIRQLPERVSRHRSDD